MAEIARGERFSLLAVEGWPIWPQQTGKSTKGATVSFCIVDRAYNHREVYTDYRPKVFARGGGPVSNEQRKQLALDHMAELEARYGS